MKRSEKAELEYNKIRSKIDNYIMQLSVFPSEPFVNRCSISILIREIADLKVKIQELSNYDICWGLKNKITGLWVPQGVGVSDLHLKEQSDNRILYSQYYRVYDLKKRMNELFPDEKYVIVRVKKRKTLNK